LSVTMSVTLHKEMKDVVFVLLQALRLVHGLVVFEDFMYWMSLASRSLNRCNKFSCSNRTGMNMNSLGSPMGSMLLYHPVAQLPCK